jgi:hypothetical protein
MTPDEFFAKYDGKGVDFDGYYGFQCMDLYRQFVKEVLEFPQSPSVNGAVNVWDTYLKDKFDKIENSPTNCPIKGDIVIWSQGVGQYGHIAICKDGDSNKFTSFDQNWPVGSLCHFQPHNYTNVLGWLRAKGPVSGPIEPCYNCIELNKKIELLKSEQDSAIKEAVDTAISKNDEKWQSLLDSANLTISLLGPKSVDNLGWRELMSIAWKKFWLAKRGDSK